MKIFRHSILILIHNHQKTFTVILDLLFVNPNKFSAWSKYIRIICYVHRFLKKAADNMAKKLFFVQILSSFSITGLQIKFVQRKLVFLNQKFWLFQDEGIQSLNLYCEDSLYRCKGLRLIIVFVKRKQNFLDFSQKQVYWIIYLFCLLNYVPRWSNFSAQLYSIDVLDVSTR